MHQFFDSHLYQWISFILSIIYFFSITAAMLLYWHNKKMIHRSKEEQCENCQELCEKRIKADKYSKTTYSKVLEKIGEIPIIKQ